MFLGAGTGDLLRNEQYQHTAACRGIAHARPSEAWNHFSSTPVDVIAGRFGLEGLRSCVVAACASSTIAIGQAADAVRSGRVDAAVAGGTDALARLTFSGFNALRLMDPEPCRPFDRGRAGMNIGEGAGILVLEEMDRARRAARTSTGSWPATASPARRTTRPRRSRKASRSRRHADGARGRRRQRRCRRSRQRARHRHAAERSRRGARIQERVRRTAARVPVTSIKSMIGHCLGAAGALEAAALALTVSRGSHSADDQSRRDGPGMRRSTSSRTWRASSACAAASRRRWGSAGTMPRS